MRGWSGFLLSLSLGGCMLSESYDFDGFRRRDLSSAGASASGGSGQSGDAGSSGDTGSFGEGGDAGAGGDAGSGGLAGAAGDAGQGGDGGAGGDAGSAGDAGQGGNAGAGQGGVAGAGGAGAAGEAGQAGAGQGGAGEAGAAGEAAGSVGEAGQGGDAGQGGSGGAAGCAVPVILYQDEDGDGFGVSSKQKSGCFAEPGWSLEKGDCLDSNEMVNPGQLLFFGIPYTNASGNPSYDYNCDGAETGAPGVLPAPDCSAASCATKEGYLPSLTPGLGLNVLCGSKKILKCTKQGPSCTSSTLDAPEPAGCR